MRSVPFLCLFWVFSGSFPGPLPRIRTSFRLLGLPGRCRRVLFPSLPLSVLIWGRALSGLPGEAVLPVFPGKALFLGKPVFRIFPGKLVFLGKPVFRIFPGEAGETGRKEPGSVILITSEIVTKITFLENKLCFCFN